MEVDKKDKPKRLGRGLESLLGPTIQVPQEAVNILPLNPISTIPVLEKKPADGLREIGIENITANPFQPRTEWNDAELQELAASIKANGIIQPVVVRAKNGTFEIIAGERRVRAARLASLKAIPALVRQVTDEEMLELALIENIQRVDLNPIERAKAYQNYLKTFSLTQVQAAEKLGEDRSVVANYLRLLDLPQEIHQMLIEGQLSMGHARAILALPTDDLRRKLANRAMASRLSVREVERLVRLHLTAAEQDKNKLLPKVEKAANIVDLENRLSSRLGTRVSIDAKRNGQRGKIIIEFYSLDDFERITDIVGIGDLEQA